MGSTERARAILVEAVTISPDDLWSQTFLAATLSRADKKVQGQKALTRAISMSASRTSLTAVTAAYQRALDDVLCKSPDALELSDW